MSLPFERLSASLRLSDSCGVKRVGLASVIVDSRGRVRLRPTPWSATRLAFGPVTDVRRCRR
jgi:hypothetical protein